MYGLQFKVVYRRCGNRFRVSWSSVGLCGETTIPPQTYAQIHLYICICMERVFCGFVVAERGKMVRGVVVGGVKAYLYNHCLPQ